MPSLGPYFFMGKPGARGGPGAHWQQWAAQVTAAAAAGFRRLYPVDDQGWWDKDDAGIDRGVCLQQPLSTTTVNATPKSILISPDLSLPAFPRAYAVEVEAWCTKDATDDAQRAYMGRRMLFTMDGAGVLTHRGSVALWDIKSDAGMDLTAAVDGSGNSIEIFVTGKAATTLQWRGNIRILDNFGDLF